MESVSLVAYKFPIGPLGLKEEIHTEIRVFGCDFWFENRGAKSVKSRNKEKIPYDGCDYTLFKIIDCGVTTVSQQQFFLFLERIAKDHTSDDYIRVLNWLQQFFDDILVSRTNFNGIYTADL